MEQKGIIWTLPHKRTDLDHNDDVIILAVRPAPQLMNAFRATALHWSYSMPVKNTPMSIHLSASIENS